MNSRVTTIRRAAWIILLLLAAAQAWTARFYATPDGISYLDLSDAVVHGRFGELVNGYWSPLYPALIGLLRLVFRPTPYWEAGVVHLLNFGLFVAALAAFEYFWFALRPRTAEGDEGAGPIAIVAAYVAFGFYTLTLTPLTLPTPDMLVCAVSFVVFGALLRLHRDPASRGAAIALGLALAAGSLAKSFVIPWAVVCLVVAGIATRSRGIGPVARAGMIWLVVALPWSVALSARLGHPTFGDTGRLTYVWYVNQVETPSAKLMPSAAATPATDSILRGVAVTPNGEGTNPIWYDPTRWYGSLKPTFDARQQLGVFSNMVSQYVASLGPIFIVLLFWFAVMTRDARAEWWARTWVVLVPALLGIGAYSMVLVTTRYVAPFYAALTICILFAARWPTRISPLAAALGVGVPLLAMVASPGGNKATALVNATTSVALFVWLVKDRSTLVMVVVGVMGAVIVRVFQPDSNTLYVVLVSLAITLGYWLAARRAEANGSGEQFSTVVRWSLISANAALLLFVAGLKYRDAVLVTHLDAREPNDDSYVASLASAAKIGAGDRIAIIGSPFDAYWIRMLRARIVAVVPPPSMKAFSALPLEQRRRLFAEFGRAGATKIVVQQQEKPDPMDPDWFPVAYIGWVKAVRP